MQSKSVFIKHVNSSIGLNTIGSPLMLKDVFIKIGTLVIFQTHLKYRIKKNYFLLRLFEVLMSNQRE